MGLFDNMMGVERVTRNMDHPFLYKTEDKFTNTTTFIYWEGVADIKPSSLRHAMSVGTGWSYILPYPAGTFHSRMRCVRTDKADIFLLDYGYHAKDWLHIHNGNLIINIEEISGAKNLKLQPTGTGTDVRNGGEISEWGHYEISKEQIKQIADGAKIEIRVSGDNTYFEIGNGTDDVLDDCKSFQLMMKAFYNNLVDRDAYIDVLNVKVEEMKDYLKEKTTSNTTTTNTTNSNSTINTTNTTSKTGNEWYDNNTTLFILLILFWPAALFGYLKKKGFI